MGTPVIDPTPLFPGNVSSPYAAGVTASGGLAPFTWALSAGSGALPAGVTLGTSTTSFVLISGTPPAAGTYNFQVKVTDTNNTVATVDLALVINPAAACLLTGQYAMLYSGFSKGLPAVGAASVNISTAGTVSGYQDYTTAEKPVAETITGTCTTRTSNNGTLALSGATSPPVYDYAVTTALTSGRVQLISGADSQSGTGMLLLQNPAAFNLPALAGDYAFGLLGTDAHSSRMGLAGTVSIDAGGMVTVGRADSNGSGALDVALDTANLSTAALSKTFTGAAYAVDSDGHATLSYTDGTVTRSFVLYLDGPNNGYVVEKGSAVGSAGLLEAQVAGPYIYTVPGWFVSGTQFPEDVAPLLLLPAVHIAAGAISSSNGNRFFAIDAATGRGVGTFNATGAGYSVFTLYVIGPNKVVTLRQGAINRSAVIEWLGS